MTENFLFFKRINPILMGAKYLQGIPNLNNNFVIKFEPDKNGIHFLEASTNQKKFYLNKNDIEKISVEDQTTIENRVGFKRLLLIGIFAFAWKKRTNVPLSFLLFEYKNEFNEFQEMYTIR